MLTKRQLEIRRNHIGAIDSPAICGVSPWATASDVYLDKLGLLEPLEVSKAMERGNEMEPAILDWAAKELGVNIRKNQYRISKQNRIFTCTLDAAVVEATWAIEGKTTGQPELWGEEGTDDVPGHVIVQVQHQMYVCDLDRVYVPVLMGGWSLELKMYVVERSEIIIKEIVKRGIAFWHNHVAKQIPPDATTPTMDSLRRIRREPNKIINLEDLAEVTVFDWEKAKKAATEADKESKRLKSEVINLLGDAEAGQLANGDRVTYMESSRKGFTVEPSTSRTLRIKKSKE